MALIPEPPRAPASAPAIATPRAQATATPASDGEAVPAGEARELELSRLVFDVYQQSTPPLRARMLECLLKPVRPLGLAAVAAGAFGIFLHRERWGRLNISVDDALRFTSDQVFDLARYVEQFQPEAFRHVASLMAENPSCLTTLSGSLLLMALSLCLPAAIDG